MSGTTCPACSTAISICVERRPELSFVELRDQFHALDRSIRRDAETIRKDDERRALNRNLARCLHAPYKPPSCPVTLRPTTSTSPGAVKPVRPSRVAHIKQGLEQPCPPETTRRRVADWERDPMFQDRLGGVSGGQLAAAFRRLFRAEPLRDPNKKAVRCYSPPGAAPGARCPDGRRRAVT